MKRLKKVLFICRNKYIWHLCHLCIPGSVRCLQPVHWKHCSTQGPGRGPLPPGSPAHQNTRASAPLPPPCLPLPLHPRHPLVPQQTLSSPQLPRKHRSASSALCRSRWPQSPCCPGCGSLRAQSAVRKPAGGTLTSSGDVGVAFVISDNSSTCLALGLKWEQTMLKPNLAC